MRKAPRLSFVELDRDALADWLTGWGEPAFRPAQLWRWVYRDLAGDFEQMTNLPRALRERLAERATLSPYRLLQKIVSEDGETHKVLLELADGETIESVLMLYEQRRTACISTQVGCPIRCAFCATGQAGLIRNLTAGEIILQALELARQARPRAPDDERPLTNIVYMGMGEPLLNYDAVLTSIRRLTDEDGFGLGARRITISTAGVVPGIRRLADEGLQIGLAVSLHAPNDLLRDQLVPLNKRHSIAQLMDSLRYYVAQTGRRITFEYALIRDINDDPALAQELVERIADLPAHVNLIPVNPAEGSPYLPPDRTRVAEFAARVAERGVACTVRLRRGIDVEAGCGQLRSRRVKDTLRP
jgi:23S rRNA (adenine2503-C2)-methyltransferase